jgi:hypothetical protein
VVLTVLRPSTLIARVAIEISVMTFFKGHVFARNPRRSRSPGARPRDGQDSEVVLADPRNTPLDLSIAKAQDAAGVFEVK